MALPSYDDWKTATPDYLDAPDDADDSDDDDGDDTDLYDAEGGL